MGQNRTFAQNAAAGRGLTIKGSLKEFSGYCVPAHLGRMCPKSKPVVQHSGDDCEIGRAGYLARHLAGISLPNSTRCTTGMRISLSCDHMESQESIDQHANEFSNLKFDA